MISALCLFVLCASQAHARSIEQEIQDEAALAQQQTTSPQVKVSSPSLLQIDAVGGMDFSSYKGAAGDYSFTTTSGYEAGMEVLVGRSSLQFETGLLYAERGGKESYRFSITTWDITYNNKYIEIPALVRYNVVNNRDLRMFVKAGAVMAVMQDSTGTMDNVQNYYSPNAFVFGVNSNTSLATGNDTKSYFSNIDPRWVAGIGGQLRFNKWLAWTLEADYQLSINKVSTSQPNGYYGTTEMSLSTESFGIVTGLVFNI